MREGTKPHIVIITTAFHPLLGGAESAVQELIKQLSPHYRFTVITARIRGDYPDEKMWEGARVIRVGWGSNFDKLWLLAAAGWHVAHLKKTEGVDLVWAIMASYAGAAAWITRATTHVPYALTLQEGDDLVALEKKWKLLMRPFGWIFRDASGIQAIAPFLADWARTKGARVAPVVISNGVERKDFDINSETRPAVRARTREELGIPHDAPTVLTISRLVEKNGIPDLIDAVKDMPDTHLIVMGVGVLEKTLKEQAADCADRIHFVGSDPAKRVLYGAAADVFCRPSLSEGQGIVFLEAMCMDVPVVATNVGGIPSIVEHEVSGILVPPHNVPALRAALTRVLGDEHLHARLVANAREHVQEFSWSLLAPRISAWLTASMR